MPRARYTAEGGTYRVGGTSFEPGDEREVDHDLANYLSDHDDFVVSVEKAAPEGDSDAGDAGDGEADSDDDQDDEEADEFDAAEFVDRTPMSEVVEDIHDGKADEHLDELDELDDLRVGVDDAIGERRAELEG